MARRARSRERQRFQIGRLLGFGVSLTLLALGGVAAAHGDLATAVAALAGSGLAGRR